AQELEVIADSRLARAHALDVGFDGVGGGIRWKGGVHTKADERHDHRCDSGSGTDSADGGFSHQRELIVDGAGFGKRTEVSIANQDSDRSTRRQYLTFAPPADIQVLL